MALPSARFGPLGAILLPLLHIPNAPAALPAAVPPLVPSFPSLLPPTSYSTLPSSRLPSLLLLHPPPCFLPLPPLFRPSPPVYLPRSPLSPWRLLRSPFRFPPLASRFPSASSLLLPPPPVSPLPPPPLPPLAHSLPPPLSASRPSSPSPIIRKYCRSPALTVHVSSGGKIQQTYQAG